MNEMNSLTHSCMHSLASLAIFAFSGSACFIMRATGAKFRMLASYTSCLSALDDKLRRSSGDLDGECCCWDMEREGKRRRKERERRQCCVSAFRKQGHWGLLLEENGRKG